MYMYVLLVSVYLLHTLDNSLLNMPNNWSVDRLGYCISIPNAPCNLIVEFSIDTYLFSQYGESNRYNNMVLFFE